MYLFLKLKMSPYTRKHEISALSLNTAVAAVLDCEEETQQPREEAAAECRCSEEAVVSDSHRHPHTPQLLGKQEVSHPKVVNSAGAGGKAGRLWIWES